MIFSMDPGIQTNRKKPRALDPHSLSKVLMDLVNDNKLTKEKSIEIYWICLSKPKGVTKRKTLGDELEKVGGKELRDEAWKRLR